MGPCLNEMQRQVTVHFISLKNTISRLEQIEPLVTIVLRLVRLVRVESPLSRLEQVVSIGHARGIRNSLFSQFVSFGVDQGVQAGSRYCCCCCC